jgi:hypothetical protein
MLASASISPGHWRPASTSIRPAAESNHSTRSSAVVSISVMPAPNCCPPMAWRHPATHMVSPLPRAWRRLARREEINLGRMMRATRVRLSRAWTSSTQMPGAGVGAEAGVGVGVGATGTNPASCGSSAADAWGLGIATVIPGSSHRCCPGLDTKVDETPGAPNRPGPPAECRAAPPLDPGPGRAYVPPRQPPWVATRRPRFPGEPRQSASFAHWRARRLDGG